MRTTYARDSDGVTRTADGRWALGHDYRWAEIAYEATKGEAEEDWLPLLADLRHMCDQDSIPCPFTAEGFLTIRDLYVRFQEILNRVRADHPAHA